MIKWNKEKEVLLKCTRNIDIHEAASLIDDGQFLKIEEVPSQENHPEQLMFLLLLNDYVHCVPFVIEDNGDIFIKTIFPNRRKNKLWKRGKLYE